MSKLLFDHFGKQVYILIDEYDTTVNTILEKNFLKQGEAREDAKVLMSHAITSISNMLQSCAKNEHGHVKK